jgi:NAD(P)-dependent dehydrogenase (short-subunit alcohol dehydrogenase family)
MKVFIVGATGGVGHRVAERLRASGHPVTAIVRCPEQAEGLARQGITPIIADVVVDSVETLADGIRGSDVVLFTAGAGGRDGPEAQLSIFPHYSFDLEILYGSVDGQKFEAADPTIKARHSRKYFGKGKGVVAYTLLANHVPLQAS